MANPPLLIVTTRLAPQVCGVGTFSWLLHQHWPGDTSTHRFLAVDGADRSRHALPNLSIAEFGTDWKKFGRMLEDGGPVNILLHYTGRGYHRLGCPTQLPAALHQWKRKNQKARLAIFFHEVPGSLPFFSRHYWFNVCNRGVVRRLARLGDLVITNTVEQASTLTAISGRSDVHCVPVASNIERTGEPLERIATAFVIFGLPFSRWQTLLAFDSEIRRWQKEGLLTKLHLIGVSDQKFDLRSEKLINSYPITDVVVRHGQLPNDEVSRLLGQCRYALTPVNISTWSKSGTLMAYLSHGCVVVARDRFSFEPLSSALLPKQVGVTGDAELRVKGEAGRRWYEANASWKVVAAEISELLAVSP